ncbi:MAG: LPS export ABC transporter permease LptF [Desulfobacula sp.]|jgi:lipopolysaccharide export system permease protein|uniref:LPS export ABC transporter permease LptF n=1 Tax=Desulfobacula sp. TaxID=2593537 RepID=UPI001D2DC560|nr:LPS export ABC transporter permease LptF [Desulfobacula sp.]MBT3484492.1 LPS export ABC transporter permease LptF [Desulfobacula sp.]MBT3803130.1 LPS export ABC transporter permease LptF [Desulfobacula sp.]MBT4024700.1 LPS export ABC transporter permease LptF [Desulfobacula sp.]MBT4197178.1 LPS export ABC transporter permease LptF [Desulfobacula sp.]
MKSFNIINRYILRELVYPFSISLFFLTFVFLMTRIPEITNIVVNYNADILSIALMIVYTLPRFLEFTIPMSVMISILLTFMRMSQENEIVALKGAGVSLYKLLPPVLIFCFLGVFLTMVITVFGVSWGKLSIKKKSIEIARSSIDAALQERQFNSKLEDVMIYVSQVDMKTKELKDIFIENRRTKGIISVSIAPSGRLIRLNDEQVYTIRLYNGIINQVDIEEGSVTSIQFENYDINIDLNRMNKNTGEISKDFDERSLADLVRVIRSGIKDKARLNEALMEFHEKFAIPFACLSLGLLAFPLGIQSASFRHSSGFGFGICFFLLYYFLLTIGWSAGETGDYPAFLGMWLPDVIMGGVGIYFLVRNARERPVRFPGFAKRVLKEAKKRIKR